MPVFVKSNIWINGQNNMYKSATIDTGSLYVSWPFRYTGIKVAKVLNSFKKTIIV